MMPNQHNNSVLDYTQLVQQLSRIITSLAETELLSRFQGTLLCDKLCNNKQDGSVVTEADQVMQQQMQSQLREHWPHIALLGEEMSAEEQQRILRATTTSERNQTPQTAFWCLDPLDGTSNFAAGIPFFSVSLALIENGQVSLGVVYDPVRRECFSACRGGGLYLNGKSVESDPEVSTSQELSDMMAVVDFKRLPNDLASTIATQHPFRSQRNFGSCALEWCWLAMGRFHLYLHGGQKLWDYAAGRLILASASGVASNYEGNTEFMLSLEPQAVIAANTAQHYKPWYHWLGANFNTP